MAAEFTDKQEWSARHNKNTLKSPSSSGASLSLLRNEQKLTKSTFFIVIISIIGKQATMEYVMKIAFRHYRDIMLALQCIN